MVKQLPQVILSFIVLFFSLQSKAQQFNFGQVAPLDFTGHLHLADSSDGAIVLYDSLIAKVITIGDEIVVKKTYFKRVLILKEDALDEGTFVFEKRWDGVKYKRDLIEKYEGYTYALQNDKVIKVSEVDSTDIYKEKYVTKVVFPKVKKGVIVELKSEIEGPLTFDFLNWKIQGHLPTVRTALDLFLTEHIDISILAYGGVVPQPILKEEFNLKNSPNGEYYFSGFYQVSTFKAQRLVYAFSGIKPFSKNNLLHNPVEHQKIISFRVSQINLPFFKEVSPGVVSRARALRLELPWKEFSSDYLWNDNIRVSEKRTERLKTYFIPSFPPNTDIKFKIDSIVSNIKARIEWNGTYDFLPRQGVFETLEKGKGNSADINAALYAMLKAIDIPVYPLLISPRGNGTMKTEYVSEPQLQKMVLAIKLGENFIFRDATDRYLNNSLLPEDNYNGKAALLMMDSVEFIDLSADYMRMSEKFQHKVLVTKENKVITTATIQPTLFRSAMLRRKMAEEKSLDAVNNWLVARSGQKPDSIVVVNEKNVDEALTIKAYFTSTLKTENGLREFPSFLWGKTMQNPIQDKDKSLPVQFDYCLNQLVVGEIEFEDAMPQCKLPEKLNINHREQSLIYQFEAGVFENKINIMSRFKNNKALFSAAESEGIEAFIDKIIEKQNEKIRILN